MPGYPSDVTDEEWALLAPFFARPDPRGNPGRYAKRDVVNAISMWSKAASRGVCFRWIFRRGTPCMTITDAGISAGCGNKPWMRLTSAHGHKQGKHKYPTYALLDSQSVKTQYASQDRGTDGGKKGQRS